MVTAKQKTIDSAETMNGAILETTQGADVDLQRAAATVQAETQRRLRECNTKIEAILDEYGYELIAKVTVQGVVIPVPVSYQPKG